MTATNPIVAAGLFRFATTTLLFCLMAAVPLEARAQTSSGVVKLVTNPPGATVYVGGKTFGPTPTLVELPAGRSKLIVTLDGYKPETRLVAVKENQILRLDVELEPTVSDGIRVHNPMINEEDNGPGTVTIVTQPPGLRVFMNDLMVPQPTPVAFDIRSGVYELTIENDEDVVYRKTIFVRVGKTLDLDLTIKRKRKIDDSDPWK